MNNPLRSIPFWILCIASFALMLTLQQQGEQDDEHDIKDEVYEPKPPAQVLSDKSSNSRIVSEDNEPGEGVPEAEDKEVHYHSPFFKEKKERKEQKSRDKKTKSEKKPVAQYNSGFKVPIEFEYSTNRSKVYRWKNVEMEECRGLHVTYAVKGTVPHIPLASVPGSGNTWTRYLLESLTGVFTGDVYNDKVLLKTFKGGNKGRNATFCFKTHRPLRSPSSNAGVWKILLIIRNPFEASLSEYNRKVGHGHVNNASDVRRDHGLFSRAALLYRYKIYPSYFHYARLKKEFKNIEPAKIIHILHYEKMVSDLENELLKLIDFLEIKVDPQRLKCLLEYPQGQFKRKHSTERMTFPFSKDSVDTFMDSTCKLHKQLTNLGLDGLPLDMYNQRLEDHFKPRKNKKLPKFECESEEEEE